MERDSGTRSGLLWEVERLLKETKELPDVLIMENVPQVLKANGWYEWCEFLENLGYNNYAEVINAKRFGIPQNRERCFMVSILGDYSYNFPKGFELKYRLKDLLEENVDEKYYLSDRMMKYVCSRMPMGDNKLNIGINMMNKENKEKIAGTICTSGGNQPNDNFIIDTENVEYDNKKGWFGIIDSYNKYMPKEQDVCGVIPSGYAKNQGTMIMEKNMKQKLCNDLIEKGVVKENYVINHSYTNGLNGKNPNSRQTLDDYIETTDNSSPCLTTRPDTLGVVVKDEINVIGNYSPSGHDASRIVNPDGIAPTVKENHGTVTATVVNAEIKPKLVGGIGDKKSNGGTQYYQQDRIYDSESIAMCHCANIPSGSYNYQLSDLRIRKLSPREVFRLMGVKDTDYNKITCSNAQKYKQAGNSIVTTCLMAIYSQLYKDCDYKSKIDDLLKELTTSNDDNKQINK